MKNATNAVLTYGLFKDTDLSELTQNIGGLEESVLALLEDTSVAEERLSEIAALADRDDRLEASGGLFFSCEEFLARCKQLADAVKNAVNRVKESKEEVKQSLLEDLGDAEGGKARTKNFKFSVRSNPDSVEVKDKDRVPQKYRKQPAPLPPWQEWPVDKNFIKSTLKAEKVKSIPGIKMVSSQRVEVKPR